MSVSPCLFVCKNCIIYCKAARANNIMRNWNTSNYEKTLDIAFYCMKDDFARLVFLSQMFNGENKSFHVILFKTINVDLVAKQYF